MRRAGDIYIDNQPFRITSYQRGTTDDMVARFGSAEKGQTNLDLFKAATQKGWRGGMFQKKFTDDQMAGYISNFHHNALDEKLYLTPYMELITKTNGGMTPDGITAWCYFGLSLYIAFNLSAPSTDTNGLVKIDLSSNTVTSITLPAAIKTSFSPITSLVVHEHTIFIGGQTRISGTEYYFNLHRYDGVTTFVDLGNSSGNATGYRFLVSYNGRLYGIRMSSLHLISNEFTGSMVTNFIKVVGSNASATVVVHSMLEYNGAIYIAKQDGLYRYNGVDVVSVLNHTKNVSTSNFKFLSVFNGRLYWAMRNVIFEFDGVNIVKVVDMSDAYTILDMVGGEDRLWVSVRYNATSPSIYQSDNFTDPIATNTYTYGLFTFNGVGFFEYKNFTYTNDAGFGNFNLPIQFTAIPVQGFALWFYPNVYKNASLETRSYGWKYWKQELAAEFDLNQIGTSRKAVIIGSLYDGGYPSVPKALNGIMTEYENLGSNILMKVEIRKVYKGVSSSWIEIFTSDNVSFVGASNDYFLHDQVSAVGATPLTTTPQLFEKIEYRVTVTVSGSLPSIPKWESLTLRYTLQPRMRRQWVIGLALFGDDQSDVDIQYNADGTRETRKANKLRSIIYDAYENKLPILFYDLDYSEVQFTTPIRVKGQDWFKSGDYIAIETIEGDPTSWLNRRVQVAASVVDYTELNLDNIGYRESIGGFIGPVLDVEVGNQVRKSYAAYVRRIQQERVIPDDVTVNDEAGYSDYSSQLVIEIIEA